MRFLKDELKRYNYTTHSVPLLCTTDVSWPIIKSLLGVFNNESVEEYIGRSFAIVSGKATSNDLSINKIKTVLHISLCHVMKAFANKVNKCFKEDKNFMKFSLSLLANSFHYQDILDTCRNLFKVLLSKFSSDCVDAKDYLDRKIESDMDSYKEVNCEDVNTSTSPISIDETEDVENEEQLPVQEDVYLQQSKRSIYFKKREPIFKYLETEIKNVDSPGKIYNIHYSPNFALYFLNNWSGLIPFWTSLHVGDQGRHGNSDVYRSWSDHFSERPCGQDPPRTQGIIEFHNKSVKNITLNSKRDRID